MRERQERPVANYEASISKVGGNQLGLYFPKDLRRLFALEPKMKVLITPLSDGAMRLDLPKDESRPLANRMKAIDQTLAYSCFFRQLGRGVTGDAERVIHRNR